MAKNQWSTFREQKSKEGFKLSFKFLLPLKRCPSEIHQNTRFFTERLLKNPDANVLTVEFAFMFFFVII